MIGLIANLPIRLKGNLKRISGTSLGPIKMKSNLKRISGISLGPIKMKRNFKRNRYFLNPLGAPEQRYRRCFADVTNRGSITAAMQTK